MYRLQTLPEVSGMSGEDGACLHSSLPPTGLVTTTESVYSTAFPPAPPIPLPASFEDPSSLARVAYPSASCPPQEEIRNATTISALSSAAKKKRTFKVIIVGDAGVGKTCLSFRFCNGRFPEFTEATIGVDFRERSVHLDNETLRIQLWDTAGQERYRQSIVAHYYRNVHAVVFVYDVTCPRSFSSLSSWLSECDRHGLGASSEIPRILVGNKCDLESVQRVTTETAQVFADQHNMALFETSAKKESEADHVEGIFMTVVHHLRRSRSMHVQSEKERQDHEQNTLLLKAEDSANLNESDWCC